MFYNIYFKRKIWHPIFGFETAVDATGVKLHL